MPQANSTTSSPRATSPSASDTTLPCSAVIRVARSRACLAISSRNRNITSARRTSDVSRQPEQGPPAAAALTAAPTSSRAAEVDEVLLRLAAVAGL